MHRTGGQALVEFVLVAPVLLVLVVLVLDVGRAFSLWIGIRNSVREGAYVASTRFAGDTPEQRVRSIVLAEGAPSGLINASDIVVAYPSPNLVVVSAESHFQPIAPIVNTFSGTNDIRIGSSAAFPLIVRSPTPRPITPTTQTPSPTLTAIPILTGTPAVVPTSPVLPTVIPIL